MAIYTLRKHGGRWTVFSGNDVLLDFDDYEEAIETTRTALNVLEPSMRAGTRPDASGHSHPSSS
jgi:hypothetical protein